jgi:hypothetical protein
MVRDTTDRDSATLTFSAATWEAFSSGIEGASGSWHNPTTPPPIAHVVITWASGEATTVYPPQENRSAS